MAPKDSKNRSEIFMVYYEKGTECSQKVKKSLAESFEKKNPKFEGLTIAQIRKTIIKAFLEGFADDWKEEIA